MPLRDDTSFNAIAVISINAKANKFVDEAAKDRNVPANIRAACLHGKQQQVDRVEKQLQPIAEKVFSELKPGTTTGEFKQQLQKVLSTVPNPIITAASVQQRASAVTKKSNPFEPSGAAAGGRRSEPDASASTKQPVNFARQAAVSEYKVILSDYSRRLEGIMSQVSGKIEDKNALIRNAVDARPKGDNNAHAAAAYDSKVSDFVSQVSKTGHLPSSKEFNALADKCIKEADVAVYKRPGPGND